MREYHLEAFVGGTIQGQISALDVVSDRGIETRPMTPYDVGNLLDDIHATEDLLEKMEENHEL